MAAHRLVWRFSSIPAIKVEQRPPLTASLYSTPTTLRKQMPLSHKSITTVAAAVAGDTPTRKLPILLFDIMDTVIRDPFYHDIPAFFGMEGFLFDWRNFLSTMIVKKGISFSAIEARMSMKELLECKHPTAWGEFEKGLINEVELAKTFFKDGRPLDLEGLKSCMRRGYAYLEGVEDVLIDLKNNGYEMHAATNYPIWHEIIEEKLILSSYLSWTFCSCTMGKRKPDPDFYLDILKHLKVEPASCIFIDDRMGNVEAALHAGFNGIHFKTADLLRKDLSNLGISPGTKTSNYSD